MLRVAGRCRGAVAGSGPGAGREEPVLLLVLLLVAAALCVVSGTAYLLYTRSAAAPADPPDESRQNHSFSRLCQAINCSTLAPTTKTILLWNPPTPEDNLGYGPSKGISIFQDIACQPNDCFMTADKDVMPVHLYDAVVIYNDRPITKAITSERRRDQRFIFFMPKPSFVRLREAISLLSSGFDVKEDPMLRYYNWTMSYRVDSDIHFPRGQVEPRPGPRGWLRPFLRPPRPSRVAPLMTPPTRLSEKPVRVAWFNELCDWEQEFWGVVRGLSSYMRVDVMARCAPFQWPRRYMPTPWASIADQYDFYLVMVGGDCWDYVSEELYDLLPLNILLVVYGGANFSAVFPPHSFVDAGAFQTVDHLATYLLFLAHHPREYAKYFWWKSHYRVALAPHDNLCRLCRKLQHPHPRKTYVSVWKYWHAGVRCFLHDGRRKGERNRTQTRKENASQTSQF